MPHVRLQPSQSGCLLHHLCTPNGTDLQRELHAIILLSEDNGNQQSRSVPLDLGLMVRMGNVELSYESHHEGLNLKDTIQKAVFSLPGGCEKYERSTYANRHPMQLLTPPENVELND